TKTRAWPCRATRGRAALELDSGRRELASNAQVGFSRGRGAAARVRRNVGAVPRGVRGGAGFHSRRGGGVRAYRSGDARPRHPLGGGEGGGGGNGARAASRRGADRVG